MNPIHPLQNILGYGSASKDCSSLASRSSESIIKKIIDAMYVLTLQLTEISDKTLDQEDYN